MSKITGILLGILLAQTQAFADIENPKAFSGMDDQDVLVITVDEISAGRMYDKNGVGMNDFVIAVKLDPDAKTVDGDYFHADGDKNLTDSGIIYVEQGDKVTPNKEIRISGRKINRAIRGFHKRTYKIDLDIRFYENYPDLMNFFWFIKGFDSDRHVDTESLTLADLGTAAQTVKLEDHDTRGSYERDESVGLFGWGGTRKTTRYYGESDTGAYANVTVRIERAEKQ